MPEPQNSDAAPADRPRRNLAWLPIAIFAAIAGLFAYALSSGDPSKLPSALIGKQAPLLTLAPMPGLKIAGPNDGGKEVPGLTPADLTAGTPTVVNFFASWCAPCVQEHPLLVDLKARTGARIAGINYKDPEPGGRRFLGRYGNPYSLVGLDESGRGAIEWGVYGMPETFVVDGSGKIVFKHVGPLTPLVIETRILPLLAKPR